MEVLTHCVHRLPLKGQKANLLSYQTLIEIEKEHSNKQAPKKGLFQNWFKKEVNKNEYVRFMALYENRLVVLKSQPD